MKSIISFIVSLLFVFLAKAQQPHYIHYNDENGIEDNEVYDIYQAKDKMVWVAGNSGVFNFNGKKFKGFTSTEQQSNALTGIQEDSFGRIWVHDFSNQIFYIEDDSLHRFNLWKPVSSGSFPRITIDSLNRLWILVNSKISCFKLDKDSKKIKIIKEFLIENSCVYYFYKNSLYTTHNEDILYIDNKMNVNRINFNDAESKGKAPLNDWISFFSIQDKFYIFLRYNKKIYELKNKKILEIRKMSSIPFSNNCHIIDNYFWVCTRNGAYRYDLNFENEKIYFSDISVSDVIKDHEGGYWFTSLNNGIYYVPNINVLIYNNQTNDTLANGYSVVKNLYGNIFTGSNTGELYQYNSGKLNLIFKDINKKEYSFLNSNNGYIYFGSYNAYAMNIKNKKTKFILPNPSIKQADSLLPDINIEARPDGLYATHRELFYVKDSLPFFIKKMSKKIILHDKKYFQQITFSRTNSFYFNRNENYLICASKDGLIRVEKNQVTALKYKGIPLYASYVTGNNQNVWISSNNYGILLYKNNRITELKHLNSQLFSLKINKLYLHQNKLYIIHKKGIQIYNIITQKINYINNKNGLFTYKVFDISVRNDTTYIATAKGFTVIPSSQLTHETNTPVLYIKKIYSNNDIFSHLTGEKIIINDNNLHIELNLVSFKNRENIDIYYRFEGKDKQWSKTSDDKNGIDFNSLNYGNYHLVIYATNITNGLSSDKIHLYITVPPPFYFSIWFILLLIIILSIIVFVVWKIRLKNINQKNAELLEKERLEKALKISTLASIKSQMNPHFIFNALNTIQSYVLSNDRLKANFYLGKFSDLMRKILAMSAKDVISLEEEIETLNTYLELENMRFNNELNYAIQFSNEAENNQINIPSMIIQPFVENAIKHGLLHKKGEKYLHISFELVEQNLLKVNITDNGIGRKASEQIKNRNFKANQSFSLNANRKRLELLNETVSNKISLQINDLGTEIKSEGTEVILFIPYT